MRLFGRKRPLHEQLADEAGLSLGADAPTPGLSAAPPGWFGEQRGEPGIHGVARARRWDAVTVAEAPALRGDAVHFVTLADGTILVDEDEPDGALAPLADAVEAHLEAPYRAEGVRREASSWGVAAHQITIVSEPGLDGTEAEFVLSREARTLTVDGAERVARAPALEAAGAAEASEFVVQARRIDGDLWEVEVSPL